MVVLLLIHPCGLPKKSLSCFPFSMIFLHFFPITFEEEKSSHFLLWQKFNYKSSQSSKSTNIGTRISSGVSGLMCVATIPTKASKDKNKKSSHSHLDLITLTFERESAEHYTCLATYLVSNEMGGRVVATDEGGNLRMRKLLPSNFT